jgi:tetratricopeptide (TPR) repeat protein
MKIHSLLALSSCAVIAACAAVPPGEAGPTASMPQVVCSVQPLEASAHANRAQSTLNRTLVGTGDHSALYTEALGHARAGLAENDQNPYHHLLAGWSAAGLGELDQASGYFTRAVALCPELEADYVEPARMDAWLRAFSGGLESYQAGDVAAAERVWRQAAGFWDGLANATFNLAIIHADRGEYEEAARHYIEALRIVDESPLYRREDVAPEGLETRVNAVNQLINVGVQFFRQDRFDRAAEIFREVLRVAPNNRDANYNLGLALMSMERWEELEAPARRAVEADPLNFQARIVLFNSFRGRAEAAAAARQTQAERTYRAQALEVLNAAERIPMRMTEITVNATEGTARISGQVTGTEQRGGPVTLAFTLYGASGVIGEGTTTVERPAQGQSAAFSFQIPVSEPILGWRYQVR